MESKTLERIGREMVSKCGYLPLAISVLGGILSEKKSVDEWDSLNKKINVNMRVEGSDEKEIERVLSLSYDDLPYRLKPCFLYLSRFQEDQDIQNVCLLWIAEGLVSPKDQEKDETLMDVALRYLRELASRSLVQLQEGELFFLGEFFHICRVHDLLRALCLAKSKEEEFFSVMDFRDGKGPSINPSSTTSCLRRLDIIADEKLDGVSLTAESFQSLRSLWLRDSPTSVFTGPKRVIDFNKLKCLRVLVFDGVRFEGEMLPTEMSKLIHLKLLSFSSCILKELPSWVGDFPFLQVLHLNLSDGTKIPNVLWKIKGLKFLLLPDDFVAEEKLVWDGLNELETLHNWNSKTCELIDISKFKNLRLITTSIYGNDNLSKFVDRIEGTRVMNIIVSVHNCDFGSEEGMALLKKVFKSSKIHILDLEESCVNICKLPDYERDFFPNLRHLQLDGGDILEDPMGTLEKLPNLRKLIFSGSFVGKEMTCHANGFPQLRHLQLYYLHYLEEWRVEEGAMPCLSHLEITGCSRLVMIPDGIKSITTLHTLNIRQMPDHFNQRVEEGGEDFDKVCHVDSIIVTKW